MKVYVVVWNGHHYGYPDDWINLDDAEIMGIFTTRDRAEKFISKYLDNPHEEDSFYDEVDLTIREFELGD